ncbi:hypothetical protein EDB89DRAFT_1913505 [Lactarius sanguifluus]|nr:hypothetical protein EDB89DRAFT_1913505 [Lactarius sanguifluus]
MGRALVGGTARLAGLLNGGGTSCGMEIALHAEHGKGAALLVEGEFVGFRDHRRRYSSLAVARSGTAHLLRNVNWGTASLAGFIEGGTASSAGRVEASLACPWYSRGSSASLAVRIHIFSGMRRPFAGVLQIVVNLTKPILLGNLQLAFNLPFDSARWKGAKYSQYFGLSLKPGNQWCFLLIREFVGKW